MLKPAIHGALVTPAELEALSAPGVELEVDVPESIGRDAASLATPLYGDLQVGVPVGKDYHAASLIS